MREVAGSSPSVSTTPAVSNSRTAGSFLFWSFVPALVAGIFFVNASHAEIKFVLLRLIFFCVQKPDALSRQFTIATTFCELQELIHAVEKPKASFIWLGHNKQIRTLAGWRWVRICCFYKLLFCSARSFLLFSLSGLLSLMSDIKKEIAKCLILYGFRDFKKYIEAIILRKTSPEWTRRVFLFGGIHFEPSWPEVLGSGRLPSKPFSGKSKTGGIPPLGFSGNIVQ